MSDAQSLLNSLNTLVCKANNEGYFTYLNDYWAVNLGWDLSELRGKPFIYYVHPGDVEATQAVLLDLVNNKTNVEGFRNPVQKKKWGIRLAGVVCKSQLRHRNCCLCCYHY